MMSRLALFFSLLFFTSCSNSEHSRVNIEASEESLIDALEIFNTAFRNGNTDKLADMITDNYVHTNGNSKSIGRESWLRYLRKRQENIESGKIEILEYKIDEMDITLHDKVAIVTGKVNVTTKTNDDTISYKYRVTNIWTYTDEGWKRAGFHDGKI